MAGITPKQAARLAYELNRVLLDCDLPKNLIQQIIENPSNMHSFVTDLKDSANKHVHRYIKRIVQSGGAWSIMLKPVWVQYDLSLEHILEDFEELPFKEQVEFPEIEKKQDSKVSLLLLRIVPRGEQWTFRQIEGSIAKQGLRPAGIYELYALKNYYKELFLCDAELIVATDPKTRFFFDKEERLPVLVNEKKGSRLEFDPVRSWGNWLTPVWFLFIN